MLNSHYCLHSSVQFSTLKFLRINFRMNLPHFLFNAVFIITISKSCVAASTLAANQSLVDRGEAVLTSLSLVFELGFFSPANSTARFLGIWYRATPNVVVWVANRERPISGRGGVLTLSENGTLFLRSANATSRWKSDSSMAASSPVLRLMDSGNLVVEDDSTRLWQSFDYPGDTRLPGMEMANDPRTGFERHLTSWRSPSDPSPGEYVFKIENDGLSQLTVLKGKKKTYRIGPWEGTYLTGLPLVTYKDVKIERVFSSEGKLISTSEVYNGSSSSIMRLSLSSSGFIQRYIMNEGGDGWIHAFSDPHGVCNRYNCCGPYGICRAHKEPPCDCLKGFVPKSKKEWDVLSWNGGCTRILPLDCEKDDGFLKFDRLKFPDTLHYRLNDSMNVDECSRECLKNCSCTAYASPYLSNAKNGCVMWFGDLIDVQQFTGEIGTGPSIYIRVPISEVEKKRRLPAVIVCSATAAISGMLVLFLRLGVMILRVRRRRRAYKKKIEELKLPLFRLATISAATGNFSRENMIGKGGFGPVYKGNLSNEQVIAVKRMSTPSGQGAKEFKNEVTLIAKLQHRNLVRILGCCVEREEKILVYEYMHNRSLDYFIFDQNRSALLDWPKRFDVIMGIARGLLYLHHDSRLKIIHRDLKTSNILLDGDLKPKISDFGLARMFERNQTMASTNRVVGTYGYMAPEYAFHGVFSVKSDIFSLGVVILEIVSGKRNRDFKHPSSYHNLLEMAWLLWEENRGLELMDQCYISSVVESQVKRCIQVGLLCVQNGAAERPSMQSVVLMLSSGDTVLPRPKKPAFFLPSSSGTSLSLKYVSRNSLTNSLEGR